MKKKYIAAKDYFSAFISQNPKHAEGFYYLGRIAFINREFDQADQYLNKSIELSPNNSEYWSLLGQNYFKLSGEVSMLRMMSVAKKGKKALEKSLELDANNIKALVHLGQYCVYAPGFLGGGIDRAKSFSERLSTLDPIEARIILLKITEKEGDIDNASLEYNRLANEIGDNSNYASFYNDYGYFLLEQEKYNDAVAQFEQYVALSPYDPNAHDSLGDGYYEIGHLKEARNAYQSALRIDPDFTLSKKKLKKVNNELKKSAKN